MKELIIFMMLSPVVYAGEFTSMIAFEAVSQQMQHKYESPAQKVPRSKCPVCKGTGKVLTGDGHIQKYMDCTNCYDDSQDSGLAPTAEPEKESDNSHILVFTDPSWCGPCRVYEANVLKPLEKEGVSVGPDPSNTIETETDQVRANQFGVAAWPTTIFYKDGKEVFRVKGAVSLPVFKSYWEQYK